MVVLTKIYTRTGDDGTTGLGDGKRLPKYHVRVAAYGTVDETNAAIGLARHALAPEDQALDAALKRIQNDLFDLGADLCVPDRGEPLPYEPLRVTDAQVTWLETEIDRMNSELRPLTSFVLPGGTHAAAALHMARTICRRAERHMVELAALADEPVGAPALKYINRLSDLLFVASRYVNGKGAGDILWQPGKNR
ncbi:MULTISPECIES: cob(I)yrinic acid a,c-diamide adenosyltransferase [Rhodomicrobium]|uniref:cob(I)yrinic acid a,c-diamide adenosyltransferase n=1 Tax=Rhodomicrobium TaxID=1068 RepID=UPI000B4B55EA|nr:MULTISPECIES: cob(I)yrinic acid a,c-diamide adenosyltransferase [Rhodomicrobium]